MPKRKITASPNLRVQIKHGIAIGPGKAQLLEAIAGTGSLSEAARLLEMSYRTAWQLVSNMNEHFTAPLVELSKGGASRGGASLTPTGVRVLTLYRRMESKALASIRAEMAELDALIAAGS